MYRNFGRDDPVADWEDYVRECDRAAEEREREEIITWKDGESDYD